MTSQLNVDTIVDKAGSGGSNIKIANTSVTVSEGGSATTTTVQGLCKAWCVADMGDNALDDSFNVSTFTDNATGKFILTFTNSYASVSHPDVGLVGSNAAHIEYDGGTGKGASSTGVLLCRNTSNSAVDASPYINIISSGDLA
jgi:hypothetical protein